MLLADLEPQFVRYETKIEWRTFVDGRRQGPVEYSIFCEFQQAQGIQFLCPACFQKNNGAVGTHWVAVTFAERGATDSQGSHGKDGSPTRWSVSGDSYSNLSLTPSILLDGGCNWHGWVKNGEIQ